MLKGKKVQNGVDFTPTIHQKSYDFISPLKHDLEGVSVLITGASRGIGEQTAISFARAGASKIAIAARTSLSSVASKVREAAKEAGRPEPKLLEIKLDVTSTSDIDEACSQVKEAFGNKLDVLVSNAGYLEESRKLPDTDIDMLSLSWDVNLKSHVVIIKAFLPLIQASNLKTIIGVSSIGAHNPNFGFPAYQTSKLGLLRFMEFVTEDYADVGVLAIGVHPGGVLTELAKNMPKHVHHRLSDDPQLGGDAMCWLASERREWLAGRYVSVNWDMEELGKMERDIVEKDLLKVKLRLE